MRIVCSGLLVAVVLLGSGRCLAQSEESAAQSTEGKGHLSFPSTPFSQPDRAFLNRNVWQGYVNYGIEAYETYTVTAKSFELYDRLGYHILRGYPLATWQEVRSQNTALQKSDIFRSAQYWQWFDNLVVFQESYGGWSSGLMVGDKIRTTLTPLILSTPRWDGIRLDGQSPSSGFTFLSTRGQDRRFSAFQARDETNPILQYGGRWYSRIGEVLTVGLTFFNQHQADLMSARGHMLRGTLPAGMELPTKIVVRVQDGSPDDAVPSRVYAMSVYLQVVRRDKSRASLTSNPAPGPGSEYDSSLRPVVVTGRRVGDHFEARGPDEAVDFEFTMPSVLAITEMHFEAAVSGDYRIGVRQTHPFWNQDTKEWDKRQWPAQPLPTVHNLDGRPGYPVDFKPTEAAPFYTLVRAHGSPTDLQPREVSFAYGIPTGQTLAGTDFEITAEEVKVRGEFAYNWQGYQFPFNSDSLAMAGRHFNADAMAGYLSGVRDFGPRLHRAQVGLELFRLDPDYSGGYDSRRGGVIFFTDRNGDYVEKRGERTYSGFTQEFELFADNDDGDDWADDTPAEEGRFQPLQPQVYSGAKAHSGVFPGMDEDGDNAPDTDRNRNGIADWTEPFLLYSSDPPDFVYGLDFNNNGVPDFRESDAEPDYPYRRDSEGYHGFIAVPAPFPLSNRLTVGHFSIQQIAGSGEAQGGYARTEYRSHLRGGMEIGFDDDVKYVRDTIRDDVYIFDVTAAGLNSESVLVSPPPDPLLMKKSLVNTGFLSLKAKPWKNLNLEARFLHFTNKQFGLTMRDGTHQEPDLWTRATAVGRADYGTRWRKFDLWMGMKALVREGHRSSLPTPESSVRFFAPILRVTYPFMPGVSIQGGMSGARWLPMRYIDNVDKAKSFRQNATVAMISSVTDNYLGYTLSIDVGMQWQRIDFDQGDTSRDSDTFGFFVESFAGF